jgi:uncharacterized protein
MLLHSLEKKELINPPTWLCSNTQYLTVMGSQAYGVSTDNSDLDIYGVSIPPRHQVFPHEAGVIEGFDKQVQKFNQWHEPSIYDQSANGGKGQEYDFTIYGIINYFRLAADCNPNVIDSLFVNRESIIHITKIWEEVRKNRKLFLHKGLAHKCRGYAFSQLHKAKNCIQYVADIRKFEEDNGISHSTTHNDCSSIEFMEKYSWKIRSRYDELWSAGFAKTKRFEQQKIHNTDVKSLYHVFRLADQAEQMLTECDLDLQEKSRREKMKAIRRGEYTYDQVVAEFGEQEKRINNLYQTSKLPYSPDEEQIKNILLTVLEHHFGSVDKAFKGENRYQKALSEIQDICRKYGV